MILSTIAIACIPSANNGNVAGVAVFAVAAMILTIVLRFVLIKSSYGFAKTDKCPFFYFSDVVVGETTCDGKK